jgi:hypothetical protein
MKRDRNDGCDGERASGQRQQPVNRGFDTRPED